MSGEFARRVILDLKRKTKEKYTVAMLANIPFLKPRRRTARESRQDMRVNLLGGCDWNIEKQ